MSIKHTIVDPGLRMWDIGDQLYLVYSLNFYNDQYGLCLVKGWQIVFDGSHDPYRPREISRDVAKLFLLGLYHRSLTRKQLKERNE